MTYLLALLAALRATRFITSDSLGEWWIVGPLKRWAIRHERPESAGLEWYGAENASPVPTPPSEWGPRSKAVKGLDCPFCVGFWITVAAVLLAALADRGPRRRAAFRLLAGAVGANYVVGHISSRIDG